ncbi:MICOS complex subunit MIC60-like [Moschus berezovskii]|uniref:MICOS complex subunit MIC60-like n=1 Tax=Moschus berezovskii TaxID=68408 RepID=UPI0024442063|nr:MICOS complex subunit MIC60-like [Moschus berezovskii]
MELNGKPLANGRRRSLLKRMTDKLSADDLNALIAHAHRRIDQLNRALAEQKATEKQHIALALEKQKLEEKWAFDSEVAKALEHHRSEIQAEQDRKHLQTPEEVEALRNECDESRVGFKEDKLYGGHCSGFSGRVIEPLESNIQMA